MSRASPCYEVRLYGLHPSVTNSALLTFFANGVTVLGTRVHPPNEEVSSDHLTDNTSSAWAQIWTASEAEVERCMELKDDLARKGIDIVRATAATTAPLCSPPPIQQSAQWLLTSLQHQASSDFTSQALASSFAIPQVPIRDPVNLARNLYVLGIPIDMTQHQFKSLFVPYGMVEHSTLLSQLDGAGRRRGFVLMSTHQEAAKAMDMMNGKIIDGYRMDVSWALVQREAKYFQSALPNRVVHPPTVPTRRSPPSGCTVLVENLNPMFFPNAGAVRDLFSHFGPVLRVTVLPGQPLTALLAFEHKVCADALVRANGLTLNGQTIFTRHLAWYGEEEDCSVSGNDGLGANSIGQNSMLTVSDMPRFGLGGGWGGLGAVGLNNPADDMTKASFPAMAHDPRRPSPPFKFASSPVASPSRSSTDSLNLEVLLRPGTALAKAEPTSQDSKVCSKVDKLNPESQEFIPGDGPQELHSSPSKGSSGTRVGSASETSAGSIKDSMKGWEAAKKLWD